MSQLSEFKASLLSVMDDYRKTHEALAKAILDETGYPIWCQYAQETPRETLAALICTWFYDNDNTTAGQTVQLNGVVGVPSDTLALVDACNTQRDILRTLLQTIDRFGKSGGASDDTNEESDIKYPSLALELMAELGFPRLNRRQATRHWVAVPAPLKSAGFFWNRYKKTVKLTRDQVQAKLDRIKSYSTADMLMLTRDQQALDAVPDQQFVQAFPESIHQRVNLVIKQGNSDKKLQRYAHTPIFYPAQIYERLPVISPLADQPSAKHLRLPVSTITIEEQPFLQAFACHRLLAEYRA